MLGNLFGMNLNLDRLIEVGEGVALIATIAGLYNPWVAEKILGVKSKIAEAEAKVKASPEVAAGLEIVRILEDGEITAAEKVAFYQVAKDLVQAKKQQS